MGLLEGKVAVITGSGRGIGRGIAILFAELGAKVVINDPGVNQDGSGTDAGPADEVVAEISERGGSAVANYDSVTTSAGGEAIIGTALDKFGRIDILVNNAGILRDRMIFNMSEQEWDDVIAVHLKGHFNCTKPASVLMRQQKYGRIINFTSESGLWGIAGQSNYGAAKAGIAGFTRVVAKDLGRYGVTCNAVAPRAWTRMTSSIPNRGGAPDTSNDIQQNDPNAVAPIVGYLASDHAWNVNGQIFMAYGGIISLLHQPTPKRTMYKDSPWTLDELIGLVPTQLLLDTENPAPPPDELKVPGRPTLQIAD